MVLAQAFPNPKYLNLNSIRNIYFEAIFQNNKVIFMEKDSTRPNKNVPLKSETIEACFEFEGKMENDIPFLLEGNEDFFICMNRSANPDAFSELKHRKIKSQ